MSRGRPFFLAVLIVSLTVAGCRNSTDESEIQDSERTTSSTDLVGATAQSQLEDPNADVNDGDPDPQKLKAAFLAAVARSDAFSEELRSMAETVYDVDNGQLVLEALSWSYRLDEVAVVTEFSGTEDSGFFAGSIDLSSDTGELATYPLWARSFGNSGWVVSADPSLTKPVDTDEAPPDLGQELTPGEIWDLPEIGLVTLSHGSTVFIDHSGLAIGHIPHGTLTSRSGSLLDWLATNNRKLASVADDRSGLTPPKLTDENCYPLAGGELVACQSSSSEPQVSVPTLATADGEPLIDVEQWQDLYRDVGWDWDQAADSGRPVSGHFVGATRGPEDGSWLLDWSGECEMRDALILSDGLLEHASGGSWETAPSVKAIGWVGDSAIYVSLPSNPTACGTTEDPATVYARRPKGAPDPLWSEQGALDAVIFGLNG